MRTTDLMTFGRIKASRHPQPSSVSGESLAKRLQTSNFYLL